jgi:hypothetical protein
VSESKTHQKLTKNNPALAQNLRDSGSFVARAARRFLMEFSTRNLAWKSTFAAAGREIWFGHA